MIVCLGTTPALQTTMTFPHVVVNETNRAAEVREYASGKSINVARVLHTLGAEALACGFLGGDSGKFIRQDLDAAGIKHDFVTVKPRTRTCITVIDQAAATATELIEEPQSVEQKHWHQLLEELDATLWRAEALVLSGSLPPAAAADFYGECTRLAAKAEVPVILDARGAALLHALPHKPFIVKLNRAELAATYAISLETNEQLRSAMLRLTKDGATWAVVTSGGADTFVTDGTTFWTITPPQVKVISAVGSGDAFAAGLAAALLQGQGGQTMPQACVLATACAAANAMTSGAGKIRLQDVYHLSPAIHIVPAPASES
ncbi:MAG TPA: 1-phosphofructokinase family hexose kinase [Tepidisphaeraceae bacterium]|jgi:1-phosphofructokinase family hexose kinase